MGYTGYDFCGWATKNDLRCADGRTIRGGAFKAQDGQKVPILWNHQHGDVTKTLGHGFLENRPEGVYVYGYFNNTPAGKNAKECVLHGDVESLSIWASGLEQSSAGDVLHGQIREVSLVIAGANPGARIESVLAHGMPIDEDDVEAFIYTDEPILIHAGSSKKDEEESSKKDEEESSKKDEEDETVADVYETLTDKQKQAVAVMIGMVAEENEKKKKEEENEMRHNLFYGTEGYVDNSRYLSHSEELQIIENAKNGGGSLKAAYKAYLAMNNLQHSGIDYGGYLVHAIPTDGMEGLPITGSGAPTYGVNNIENFYPDYKPLSAQPEFISRDMGWVQDVLSSVGKVGYSRIKSMFADITEDEARARGYIKGTQKKEEVFTTLKRVTSAQTIYKLQKLDRDDVLEITDFAIVAWIKSEMEIMLNEEKARAILIGDGRPSDSQFKIKEDRIRPIAKDVDLFNVKIPVKVAAGGTEADMAKAVINAAVRGRKKYKGSGRPALYTTEDVLTEMLMLEDGIGHKLYKTETELATALRVSRIVTVEPMEGSKISVGSGESVVEKQLLGIIVNLADYKTGTDKGENSSFEDFDINFNQYTYLLETRFSGALVKPFSALTLYLDNTTAKTASQQSGTYSSKASA